MAKAKAWRQANRERWNRGRHKRAVQKRFGVTSDEYERLYKDGVCEGCGSAHGQTGRHYRHLALDHNHATGARRGLLCHDCNRTIGTAHEKPEVLRRLADYLERHQ